MGVAGGREADGEERRGRAVRSDSRADNLWLTIHESIGHPTELDRAIGEEANYAGTSFGRREKVIGQLQYGPPIMNIQADRTQEGSLSRVAWDDEGVPADQWLIVEKGSSRTTRRRESRWRGFRS